MAPVEVRLVRPEEYEEAGRVVVSAYQALPGAHMSGGYAAELADVARRATEAEVYVALGSSVLGCVTLVPGPASPWAEKLEAGEAGIRMMAVTPPAQGRGIGTALLAECLARAGELGCRAVLLHSTPWMGAAHRMYVKAGFERLPERDWLPVPDVPLLAFRRDLGTAQAH